MAQDITSLHALLDVIEKDTVNVSRVSLGEIMESVGSRSFGPLLLIAGLVTVTPVIGDIPGVPVMMGLLVLLTALQLLCGRKHFWLPQWLLKRSVKRQKICKMLSWLRKPAARIDSVLHHRLPALTHGPGVAMIALATIAIALVMPAMELVPFSVNIAGALHDIATPTIAAAIGKAADLRLARLPPVHSRLIWRPTTKKNSVISAT